MGMEGDNGNCQQKMVDKNIANEKTSLTEKIWTSYSAKFVLDGIIIQ